MRKASIGEVAKSKFGYEVLRPGQERAIRSLLDGHDTLVVQPTGSGKSAIYQIATVSMKGTTLIVSPLLALQKDQLDSLEQKDAGEAAAINSHVGAEGTREAFERLAAGELKFLFMAPEQLRKAETLEKLKAANVAMIAIDEAHCISEWGHDFRPDYLHLGTVIEELGHPVVLAMTATAAEDVRKEIVKRLGLRDCRIFVSNFDRPNIYLRVDHLNGKEDKFDELPHRVRWADKPGIVYVATRKNAEMLVEALERDGVTAVFYHAGLKAKERERIQEAFMGDEAEVIVATNAFGMGIDKQEVRFVYHYDISDSLDNYFQEVGRAGRDGKPAEAILFYRHQDLGIRKFQKGAGKLDEAKIEQVVEALSEEEGPLAPEEIVERTELSGSKLSELKVVSALHRLEDVGAVESMPTGEVELVAGTDLAEATEAALREEKAHQERSKRRIEQMQEYAELSTCRRQYLLGYFGDEVDGPCGNCDNCVPGAEEVEAKSGAGTRREVAG